MRDVRLFDGKSGTGGLWMAYVVPPVLYKNGVLPFLLQALHNLCYVNHALFPGFSNPKIHIYPKQNLDRTSSSIFISFGFRIVFMAGVHTPPSG